MGKIKRRRCSALPSVLSGMAGSAGLALWVVGLAVFAALPATTLEQREFQLDGGDEAAVGTLPELVEANSVSKRATATTNSAQALRVLGEAGPTSTAAKLKKKAVKKVAKKMDKLKKKSAAKVTNIDAKIAKIAAKAKKSAKRSAKAAEKNTKANKKVVKKQSAKLKKKAVKAQKKAPCPPPSKTGKVSPRKFVKKAEKFFRPKPATKSKNPIKRMVAR